MSIRKQVIFAFFMRVVGVFPRGFADGFLRRFGGSGPVTEEKGPRAAAIW